MICSDNKSESLGQQKTKILTNNGPKTYKREPSEEEQKLRSALAPRYKIIRKLGAGGMASVYLAHEIDLDREVAIKLLPEDLARDRDLVERFKREAQFAAKLEHKNIVRIYQIGEENNLCFFVMNYIDRGSITDQIISRGALPLYYIIHWGIDVCSALEYAHKQGIIHRDLKPDNIMIDRNGRAIVMDFGIACAAESSSLANKNELLGSPQYMSPEQARGEKIDSRSDIYSLGIVFYQMATGTLPFQRLRLMFNKSGAQEKSLIYFRQFPCSKI